MQTARPGLNEARLCGGWWRRCIGAVASSCAKLLEAVREEVANSPPRNSPRGGRDPQAADTRRGAIQEEDVARATARCICAPGLPGLVLRLLLRRAPGLEPVPEAVGAAAACAHALEHDDAAKVEDELGAPVAAAPEGCGLLWHVQRLADLAAQAEQVQQLLMLFAEVPGGRQGDALCLFGKISQLDGASSVWSGHPVFLGNLHFASSGLVPFLMALIHHGHFFISWHQVAQLWAVDGFHRFACQWCGMLPRPDQHPL
mmetsp:Transcript_23416/g.66783  ORF Transcript_23416/g.66783 Transcript_23416/m.66783 type:complete len:258 (-) Transcript_23416:175-948(-)